MRVGPLLLRRLATNRPLAIAAGLLLDRVTGEPRDELHPVALFGTAMGRVEERIWDDRRGAGIGYAAIGTATGAVVGVASRSVVTTVSVAVAGTQLRTVAGDIAARLEAGDLDGARAMLPSLVGRDPAALDEAGISAAVIESVAENSVDAVVAPVFWAMVGGAPGAAAYRAINTMDAMVGHRSERYERFGWAAARLDDAANWIPARVFALLVAAQDPARRVVVARLVRRDAAAHPSPNAGVAETAMAATIGRQLGGPLRYGEREEDRPTLGDGPRPDGSDIARAVRVADRAEWILTGVLVVAGLARRRRT